MLLDGLGEASWPCPRRGISGTKDRQSRPELDALLKGDMICLQTAQLLDVIRRVHEARTLTIATGNWRAILLPRLRAARTFHIVLDMGSHAPDGDH